MVAADLEKRAVNVVRALAVDAVQRAGSGHPGTPMALAPLAHVLYTRILRYDAAAPDWPDRDRFVLSAGHASMLLYAMLHLTGHGLTLDDLRAFRQWGSRTPGHPEVGCTPGVEVTTGPLGQGIANAVGFAIAERHMRERFGNEFCDHRVFTVCGDGDLMEGVSHEAASLAGHLGLGHLVAVFDDNHITIDGPTDLSCSDDAPGRFSAYGWHVVEVGDAAEDLDALEDGLRQGIAETDRPTLVVVRSHIGYPSPKVTDTSKAHGEPLGAEEIARVKEILGLPADDFSVPADVLDFYRAAGERGRQARREWESRREAATVASSDVAAEMEACSSSRPLEGWAAKLPRWETGGDVATRVASGEVLGAIFDVVPGLVGGGADLTGNTGTAVAGAAAISRADASGRLVYFGIREHAMGAVMNGMALSGLLPFGGTFFVFSDYMRPAVRLAALSGAKVAFVWTHDSIGVGEDGPTHQPVEQLAAIRAIPGLRVMRPADANEVAAAWRVHIDGDGPTAMILTRQKVPVLDGTAGLAEAGVAAGAYVLVEEAGPCDLVLVGTGSEVSLCVAAREIVAEAGVTARVVSMPSWESFEEQADGYRDSVLPPGVPTLAVEAGVSMGWARYADDVVALDRFGASAPGGVVMAELGFTPEHVAERALSLLGISGPAPETEGLP